MTRTTKVGELVAERARRFGPLPFDEVLELALYHPDFGFYCSGGEPGRRGDFLTSPEVGPLFGAVVARALDRWWDDLGRPDPYFVVEAGAGAGALAAAVLGAVPACAPALRYLLVERSDAQRERQARRLPLEPARQVLGPASAAESGDAVLARDPDESPSPAPASGPLVASLAELPAGPLTGVVLANELLDNLPFRLLERSTNPGGWAEVRVDAEMAEVAVPAAPALAAEADRLAPDAPEGARIPLQHQVARWLGAALAVLRRGRVVVVDYTDSTPSLARRPMDEWLRTYRGHGRGGSPLSDLGLQDVTCEVAVDQLAHVRPPASNTSQAEFLGDHGLDEVVDAARATWEERAAIGDLEALKARNRISEAAALTDPSGLDGFRVVEWDVR